MTSTRNRLYVFLTVACVAGYAWLIFNLTVAEKHTWSTCLFKNVTGIPCPACGSTRSVAELLSCNIQDALFINPFGLIIAFGLIVMPLWLLFDLLMRKSTFFKTFQYAEGILRKKVVAIPLIVLVLINWIWNILKGV